MTWPTNRWYVAAREGEVDRTPMARMICGVPMAPYREPDRSVVAPRDACPHRLPPLSRGRAEEMPVKSEVVPKALCAERIVVVERHRFVRAWIDDGALADPPPIPGFRTCSTPGWTFDGGGSTARFEAQRRGVSSEEVGVLEAQQRSIAENPHMKRRTHSIDTGSVRARAVIDRLVRAQTP